MKVRRTVAAAAMTVAVGASVGLASPANAAPTPYTLMPGPLKGVVLQQAVDAINASLQSINISVPLILQNATGPTQVIYNYTNWYVCRQSPGTNRKLTAKTKAIALTVRRPNEKCS